MVQVVERTQPAKARAVGPAARVWRDTGAASAAAAAAPLPTVVPPAVVERVVTARVIVAQRWLRAELAGAIGALERVIPCVYR